MFGFLFGNKVEKLNISLAVNTAKRTLCTYFGLKDTSICRTHIEKDKKMGYAEAKYGNNSYFRIFFCNPLKKGDLPVMAAYYGVKCSRPLDGKIEEYNKYAMYFNCSYTSNEIQFIHTEQLMQNCLVQRCVNKFFTRMFEDKIKARMKAVSVNVDL